jgi:hypothetical protein
MPKPTSALALVAFVFAGLHCSGPRPEGASGASAVSTGPTWKVGLYTDSSMATFQSEQAALQGAGASAGLSLYLNYADFRSFEGSPTPGAGIADVGWLNQNGVQLVLAFEPTNASFCTYPSITSGSSTRGCRLSDLGASSPYVVAAGEAYAEVAALADALTQPLILRFASEMNANWDDWDYGYDPAHNGANDFVAAFAFAHHYITKNLHSGKVLFAFAPNNHSYDGSDFASDVTAFWPGSANVDIIGLDGYSVDGSFQSDFDTQLGELEALGAQPLMLAEFAASTAVPGGRTAWLQAAVSDLENNHPRVQFMNWFDSDKSHPYRLADTDGSGSSLYSTFAADVLVGGGGAPASAASAPPSAPPAPACDASGQACQVTTGACCDPSAACQPNAAGNTVCCIADGNASTAGDGSDCCSAGFDPTAGTCGAPSNADAGPSGAACDPSGQACDAATDTCCDPTAACQPGPSGATVCCISDGTASTAGDGSDCCSGNFNASTGTCGG